MIPYILAAVGGYLIGDSLNAKLFAGGGMMADGGDAMAKGGKEGGGYVAVSEKDGYWYIISKPTTKEKAEEVIKMGVPRGEVGKVVTIAQAKSQKKLIGEEYLSQGGKVKWIQDALDGNTKGALRATAKRKGLLRGDENLSKTDLKKLQKMGGKTAKRAHLAETLSKFENGGRIWSEIKADFEDDGYIFVDGWLTENDDEEGKTIAKINIKSGEVICVDDRAKNDSYAQEVISEAKKQKR
jgi:hypothetical protein